MQLLFYAYFFAVGVTFLAIIASCLQGRKRKPAQKPVAVDTTLKAVAFSLVLSSPALAAGGSGDRNNTYNNDSSPYGKAVEAIKAKDYNQAIDLLNRFVMEKPKHANAWNYLGFSLRKLGQFDQAKEAYFKALSINPDHLGANEYLGELYVETGVGPRPRTSGEN